MVLASLKSESVVKSVVFSAVQQLHESSIDGPGRVFCIPGQSVAVLAEGVHILRVTHKGLYLTFWQRLYHADEGVAQSYRLTGQPIGSAEHLPALVVAALCLQAEHTLTLPGNGPLRLQDGSGNIGQNE